MHRLTAVLAAGLEQKGVKRDNQFFFDTLTLDVGGMQTAIIESAKAARINLRILGRGKLGVSLDETCTAQTVEQLLCIFLGADHGLSVAELDASLVNDGIPAALQRTPDSRDVWRTTAGAAIFLAKGDTTDITEVRNVPSLPSFRQEGADG